MREGVVGGIDAESNRLGEFVIKILCQDGKGLTLCLIELVIPVHLDIYVYFVLHGCLQCRWKTACGCRVREI